MLEKIGNSNFTYDWFRQVIGKYFQDQYTAVNTNIVCDELTNGNGFWSQIICVRFEIADQHRNLLPKSVIIKLPRIESCQQFMEAGLKDGDMLVAKTNAEIDDEQLYLQNVLITLHNNEVDFYRLFPHYDNINFHLPIIYHLLEHHPPLDQGVIVMEDLSKRGTVASMIPGLTIEQVEAVIDQLASLHAYSLQSTDWIDKEADDQKWYFDRFAKDQLEMAMQLTTLNADWFSGKIEKIAHLYTKDYFMKSYRSHQLIEMPPVIVHGDLYSNNILWKRDQPNHLLAIIDWQLWHAGNCCEDIARLVMLNLSGADRRLHIDRLLRLYHHKLIDRLGYEPFTIEKLYLAYRTTMPYSAMFMLFGVPMFCAMPTIVSEEKHKFELLLRAKMLLDDVLDLIQE